MSRNFSFLLLLLQIQAVQLAAATIFYVNSEGRLVGHPRPEISDAASALAALAVPPSVAEAGQVLMSGIPSGTKLIGFSAEGEVMVIEFSQTIIGNGLDDARHEMIFEQVRATLAQFGITGSIRLQTVGRGLSSYLPPVTDFGPRSKRETVTRDVTGALSGKVISLSPGHGRYWNGSSWVFARPVYCAPLSREDDHNVEISRYLDIYLTQDGAVTKSYRNLNPNYGNYPTGEAWWRMAACYWTKQTGYPCSVYASSTADCDLGIGASESGDAIRAGPVAANYDDTDAHIALHSNGLSGDCTGSGCPNGTVTYFDSDSSHAAWTIVSSNLAKRVNAAIVDAIRTKYTDSVWSDRGVADAQGAFAETRIPNRPAILIELAFHDTCDRDGLYLQDNFFRSTTMWGVYKGICQYFGVTPTWDYYSYEVVTNSIPTAMAPGTTVAAQITLRNRGVLWNNAKQFRLGAVGDSDPFTATTRYNVGTEVEPNSTKTFTVTLTAPTTPGTYTTDWRMVREGVTWFGPTVSRSILVQSSPTILTPPQSLSVVVGSNATLSVVASGTAPLSYQWRFNGADLPGATSTSFTRNNAQPVHSGNYQVVVSNAFGVVTSSVALLQIMLPPLQTLFLDNFDVNTSANWVTNRTSADTRVTFNYNYAANGIPSAPNSTNGTTRGVKFEANMTAGVAAAINISPAGQSFGGDFRLHFDMWLNQNGPFPAGGTGSTQHGTAGLGTAGNRVQWTGAGSVADGIWFAVDGEGQASDSSTTALNDFGAFSGTTYYAATSGVYTAGTATDVRGNNHSYYASTFPGGQIAPAAQGQSGALAVGTMGFAWRDVIINKSGNTVEWLINGLKIATITGASFTASNIFLGYWDYFPSLSSNTNLSFGLFDNVRVERFVTNVPPYITAQPQSLTVTQNANATFNLMAGGTAPLAYQWRFNGTNLAGATGSSFTVNNVQPMLSGNYSVFITNASGTVTSSNALLSVIPLQSLKFESASLLSPDELKLVISGEPGTVTIQWSTNLADWETLTNLANPAGTIEFTDTIPADAVQRYYRARTP